MGQVDDLQNAEEFVTQQQEAEQAAVREQLAEDLRAAVRTSLADEQMQLQSIPVADIRTGLNMRRELADIDELALSIAHNGQQAPVKVRRDDDGEWLLVAGHRRHAAIKLLDDLAGDADGRWPVWCTVSSSDTDESDHFIAQAVENDHTPLDPKDWARGIRLILDAHPDWTAQQVADVLGKKPAFVRRHLRLLDGLPSSVLTRLEEGDLTFTAADLLRQGVASGALTEDEAAELADGIADGDVSTADVKDKVKPAAPEAPEGYDELSRELDQARFEQKYGSQEEKDTSDALEDAADAILSGSDPAPWEDAADDDDTGAVLVHESSDRQQLTGDITDQAAGLPDEQIDRYLLGLLLNRYMHDDYLAALGCNRSGAYQYAADLSDENALEQLRNTGRIILSATPNPPKSITGS